MPIPWINKNRVTQFSQIIADLHSSKRGASPIFVQTAFPASLVDLLINNRTRFTRPKSNKPFHRRTSDPPSPEMPSLTDYAELDRHEYASLTHWTAQRNLHANDRVEDSGHGVNRVGKNNDGSGSKTLLVTFFMMLVVVVSIASVEKLTVGITVSAFAVLFLEYAWKRVVLCSKPNVEINVVEAEFEEIKVVGVCSEETSFYDDVFQLNSVKGDKKLDCSESEEQEYHSNEKVVDSCRVSIKVSRSVKLKSKLKKLLTKKLQSSGKEIKEKRGREDGRSYCVEKGCETKEEVDNVLHNVKLGNMRVNSEEKRTERVGNSGYLVLFVIALVGLVVGRLPALILAMTWCFILKIVTIRGRSKASLIKCSVPNS